MVDKTARLAARMGFPDARAERSPAVRFLFRHVLAHQQPDHQLIEGLVNFRGKLADARAYGMGVLEGTGELDRVSACRPARSHLDGFLIARVPDAGYRTGDRADKAACDGRLQPGRVGYRDRRSARGSGRGKGGSAVPGNIAVLGVNLINTRPGSPELERTKIGAALRDLGDDQSLLGFDPGLCSQVVEQAKVLEVAAASWTGLVPAVHPEAT